MSNILNYSIALEWLEGAVGDQKFSMRAWSGGGRGRKGAGAEHTLASYDTFRKTDHKHGITGGPLPEGLYICHFVAHHPRFHQCIFLEQTLTAVLQIDSAAIFRFYDRAGFYVHGRGPHGSDGCIVPQNEADRHKLNNAIKNASGAVLLKVKDAGMPLPAAREVPAASYA